MPVLNHGGLSVAFTCTKPDVWNKSNSTLVAKFANSTADPMYGLSFQCAVPKFVTMERMPPTSTTVPGGVAARGGGRGRDPDGQDYQYPAREEESHDQDSGGIHQGGGEGGAYVHVLVISGGSVLRWIAFRGDRICGGGTWTEKRGEKRMRGPGGETTEYSRFSSFLSLREESPVHAGNNPARIEV